MKKLLEMPMSELMNHLNRLRAKEPVTVQDALYYCMFMQSIADELAQCDGDIMRIDMSRIDELSKQHGGFVEVDWKPLEGDALRDALIHNATQGTFFMRLAHFTAAYLKADKG